MTHTAPATGTPAPRPRTPAASSAVDPMAPGTWLPVLLGVVYGFWISGISRDASGYQVTGWNIFLGFAAGIAVAAVAFALHRVGPALRSGPRAMSWAVFAGLAFGFCYSQTGHSVLRSTGISLAVAAGVFAATYYHYYINED
ncbi:hypothetical protein [Streptomyces uncialis]|uniref:Uncharacterized protein n=1 Tax=Streptomyces uncialis TaxID=1048205 RepID=A0A1Q4VCF3_9ACTN|nr:hypothetical protein [Streptomyces uncialis]MCX4661374.1 hypothetical protein [Streptomyces uncialis]OKH95532.1 hypothetical protein AB852_01525 [Streptomyces uncialis]WST69269.1 hypothetical protein OG268_18325 [Streptomyces uncialis]